MTARNEEIILLVTVESIGAEAEAALQAAGVHATVVKARPEQGWEDSTLLLTSEGNFSGLNGIKRYIDLVKRLEASS